MAGGEDRTPVTSSPRRRPRLPGGSVHGSSLECQKEGPCSSFLSASSNKSALQMVAPVHPPKSLHSPYQTVTSVQPSNSLYSGSISFSFGSDSGAAPFDICMGNNQGVFKLNRSLLEIYKEKRRARALSNSVPQTQRLRPGMVLLKNYLKPDDQVAIVKLCRDLGITAGGFFKPGYGDETSLQMMCLGKNWDPFSSSYGDVRPFGGVRPPNIPERFKKLVEGAIEASYEFLEGRGGTCNPSTELPPMLPDTCIVNFYPCSGRLDLHQMKQKAVLTGDCPVVSFSLGDTAEFLYGDLEDDDKASKIDLESGDVLIFGGQSRRIFHGVSYIKPKTAPSWLTDQANLRPGRLNLTFRQYKDTADVTPVPFDMRMYDNDAAPLQHLGPGMVLLKKFLKANDQVEIITLCRNHGVKTGGSYTPGYIDEGSLSPQRMDLGKKWDPYSSSDGNMRPFDGAKLPDVPKKFKKLVEDAIEASHEFLERRGGTSNPLVELPPMSPDMCTVNFDTDIPIAILDQDKDVTEASLTKELPVVVISLGDTAEFVYCGIRHKMGSKIDLESGDVLIFGGQSRRISHAISSIKPETAPKWLADKTSWPSKSHIQAILVTLAC